MNTGMLFLLYIFQMVHPELESTSSQLASTGRQC